MDGKSPDEEIRKWSAGLLTSAPKDEAARQRFQGRLADVARKRGVPVETLPRITTWAEVIELDEGRAGSRESETVRQLPIPQHLEPCARYWIYPGLIQPLRVEPTPWPMRI